uniref:Uncharacterized protein n=1 Tax=Parascaris univalens TaxID=6257 RepID=A0A915CA97_PARUN
MFTLRVVLVIFFSCTISIVAIYTIPQQRSYSQLDNMISRCFRTICKDWMHECHWFCDSTRTKSLYERCFECLSWRGRHCFECFDM